MKRRITVEQLQELTEEQKQKLRELWKPQVNDVAVFIDDDSYDKALTKRWLLPLLDIGQMIGLLMEKKMATERLEIESPRGLINTYTVWYGNGDFPEKYEAKELCDCLWEAIRELL